MKKFVEFKSEREYFEKEKSLKNNTVRVVQQYEEKFRLIQRFCLGEIDLWIRIIDKTSGEFIERKIEDVSYWERLVIITFER